MRQERDYGSRGDEREKRVLGLSKARGKEWVLRWVLTRRARWSVRSQEQGKRNGKRGVLRHKREMGRRGAVREEREKRIRRWERNVDLTEVFSMGVQAGSKM
jgi:hypothetical protein